MNEIRGFVCAKCANGFPEARKLTFGEAEICIDCANLIADEGEMVLMAELLEAKIIKPESLGDDGEK